MPDFNDSLPQIAPEQDTSQPSPPPTRPFIPEPSLNNDLAGQENASLGSGAKVLSGRHFPVRKILAGLVLFAIILISYYIYFIWIPKSQAKSYVEQADRDFFGIIGKLDSIKSLESPLENTSSSFEIAKSVYFDVGQPLFYVHSTALIDAKEDLENVKSVQLLIVESRRQNEKFRVSGEVKALDESIDLYLDALEDGMNKLYIFENFRIEMLYAIGEEQAGEIEKLAGVYSASADRAVKIEYVDKLVTLTQNSLQKLKSLGSVPDDALTFYNLTIETHEDLGATLVAMQKDYDASSADGDNQAVVKLSEFGRRQLERNNKVTKASKEVVKNSETGKVFAKAVEVEQEIKEELVQLRERFKIEPPKIN